MKSRLRFLLWLFLAGTSVTAMAHHSFAVHFLPDKLITVRGVVKSFQFRNPHGQVVLTVTQPDGTTQEWRAETNSPNVLRRRGWTPESIPIGEEVSIEGYPARDGSNFMRIYRVVFADGHEIVGQRPMPAAPAGKD